MNCPALCLNQHPVSDKLCSVVAGMFVIVLREASVADHSNTHDGLLGLFLTRQVVGLMVFIPHIWTGSYGGCSSLPYRFTADQCCNQALTCTPPPQYLYRQDPCRFCIEPWLPGSEVHVITQSHQATCPYTSAHQKQLCAC